MTISLVSLPRAAALSIAITAFASPAASAQTPAAAPVAPATQSTLAAPSFARLIQGRKVVVTMADGEERQGFFAVSPAGLVADAAAPGVPVPFDQIMRVEKLRHRVRNGLLIGLGAGVTAGLATVCHRSNYCLETINVAGLGAAGGAAVGAVLKARNRNDDVIYDAGSRFLGTPAFARRVVGEKVWITTSDGARRKALVVALSPTGMTIDDNGTSVPFDRIVKVQEVRHDMRRGILIGLGAGLAHGVLGAAACGDRECVAFVPVLAGLGLGVGAAIGALVNVGTNRGTVYDATRRTTTATLVPILSPTRKGVAFSMTWR